ncbi:MAG: hypothetical protein VCF07_16140, partial [Nitrospinota bacterium]
GTSTPGSWADPSPLADPANFGCRNLVSGREFPLLPSKGEIILSQRQAGGKGSIQHIQCRLNN